MIERFRVAHFVLFVLILCGSAGLSQALLHAQGQTREPAKAIPHSDQAKMIEDFLSGAREKYALHRRNGLESFGMEIKVFGAADSAPAGRDRRGGGGRRGGKEYLESLVIMQAAARDSVTYEWESPDVEEISAGGQQGRDQSRSTVQSALRGLWKDIVAGSVFAVLDARERTMEGTDEGIVITCSGEDGSEAKVLFDPDSFLVLRVERGGDRESVVVPSYAPVNGLFRLQGKMVTRGSRGGDQKESSFRYGGYRTISGFDLPTSLSVNFGRAEIELLFRYIHINGKGPEGGEIDPKVVKAAAKEFEKRYSKLSDPEKIAAMKELVLLDHDLAALAIAKKGLADKSLTVRAKAAEMLGRMERRNVVALLAKALKPNEENLDVYVALVTALGRIGDPKAIPHLSKDFWGFKERSASIRAGQAKIAALGMIRSKKSVDALIDLSYKFGRGRQGTGRLVNDAVQALRALTGQDFGQERDDWKDWWKKNKAKFKLEEDN